MDEGKIEVHNDSDYGWGEEKAESNEEGYQHILDNGKVAINNLLWTFLPGHVTLDEADKMATNIYMMMVERWENK